MLSCAEYYRQHAGSLVSNLRNYNPAQEARLLHVECLGTWQVGGRMVCGWCRHGAGSRRELSPDTPSQCFTSNWNLGPEKGPIRALHLQVAMMQINLI